MPKARQRSAKREQPGMEEYRSAARNARARSRRARFLEKRATDTHNETEITAKAIMVSVNGLLTQ